MDIRNFATVDQRRKAVEKELSLNLPHIGSYSFDQTKEANKNCENMIGVGQIPIGIAGPIRVKSEKFKSKNYYIPLATTEGALLASVNRGCKAINASGGVGVFSKKIGITRAPVFVVDNLLEGKKFIDWIENNTLKIKKICESTSSHVTFLDCKSFLIGRNVFLRFNFDTQDAMGMNMATIATTEASEFIEQHTRARLVSITGNVCVDKKPSVLNFIEGRGICVWADAEIPQGVVSSVLKTDIQSIVEAAERKLHIGSILSHTIGANAHAANVLAAIFTATGQDIAHVAECSTVVTTAEEKENKLYISVYLPDLVVGTVGGGTGLPTQKEALEIMGVYGGDNGKNAQRLAEIIGAAVLAGEISLLASLAENSLAKAHQNLGRKGK